MSVEAYHTKHGTRYCVRYRIAGKSTDKRGFALKRDAETWEVQQLLHPQTTSLYHGPHRTVDQLFEEAVKRNLLALKPGWLQTVESKYRMHVQPEFGRLPRIQSRTSTSNSGSFGSSNNTLQPQSATPSESCAPACA